MALRHGQRAVRADHVRVDAKGLAAAGAVLHLQRQLVERLVERAVVGELERAPLCNARERGAVLVPAPRLAFGLELAPELAPELEVAEARRIKEETRQFKLDQEALLEEKEAGGG